MLVPDWIFIRYASHLSFPLNSNSYPQMKHKFYNDGNTAGLLVLSGRGLYHYTSSFEEGLFYTTRQQPNSPPYPSAIYSIHALNDNLQCAGQQWAGRRTNGFTSIYKFVYTGSMKREGNRNYLKWGFDQGCLDMVQYLHKNLTLVKEKFQYWRWWI